jgi:hypothetical protein
MINGDGRSDNLRKDHHTAYVFVIVNLSFYIVSIFFLLYASCFTTIKNYNKIRIFRVNLIFAIFLFGCWGLSIIYGKKMSQIKWYPKYKDLYLLLLCMAWLRTFFIFMLIVMFLIFGLYYFIWRRRPFQSSRIDQVQKERLKRLPIIRSFLESKGRKYDPNGDCEVKECCICMEDFEIEGEKIA